MSQIPASCYAWQDGPEEDEEAEELDDLEAWDFNEDEYRENYRDQGGIDDD